MTSNERKITITVGDHQMEPAVVTGIVERMPSLGISGATAERRWTSDPWNMPVEEVVVTFGDPEQEGTYRTLATIARREKGIIAPLRAVDREVTRLNGQGV